MRQNRIWLALAAAIACGSGQEARAQSISSCKLFPSDNIWNVPVDTLPVDPNSDTYVTTIGADANFHADFGSGIFPPETGGPIGVPYVEVPGSQPKVSISFEFDEESDPGPYPIPPDAPIEGGEDSDGDRHILVVDRDNCVLYEVFNAFPQPGGGWTAGSGAVFDLNSNALRPEGWTSADAAGLAILPGLVRFEEVAQGEIRHALRFTAPQTRRDFIWPARHFASDLTGPQYPPMGQRFRLRAAFDISGFHPQVQVILRAMKKYGIMLADNGSAWFISGVPDERWDNDVLRQLRQLQGSDFEAVDVSSLMVDSDSGSTQGAQESVLFFPLLADGLEGSIRFQTSLILLNSGPSSSARLEIFDSQGNPMEMALGDLGNGSSFFFELGRGQSISVQSPGTGTLKVGYARLSAGPDVAGNAIFTRLDAASGVLLYQSGVPATKPASDFSLFLDSLGNKDTGLALVHPPAQPAASGVGPSAAIVLRLYDKAFNLIGEEALDPLPPGHQRPRFIHELLHNAALAMQAQEMEGTVTISSSLPLAALTLRQNDDPSLEFPQEVPTLTAMPVVPGRADKEGSGDPQ